MHFQSTRGGQGATTCPGWRGGPPPYYSSRPSFFAGVFMSIGKVGGGPRSVTPQLPFGTSGWVICGTQNFGSPPPPLLILPCPRWLVSQNPGEATRMCPCRRSVGLPCPTVLKHGLV